MVDCKNMVIAMVRRDGSLVERPCGSWFGGEKLLCDACLEEAEAKYPQGWTGYPGDTCEHGVYVGGCGRDYICPKCEAGHDYEEAEDDPEVPPPIPQDHVPNLRWRKGVYCG